MLIRNTVLQQQGTAVMNRPLKGLELAGMDLIVESHECLVPDITRQLIERFAPTHAITVVEDNGQRQIPDAPAWFNNLASTSCSLPGNGGPGQRRGW